MDVSSTYNKHWDDKFSSRDWGRYPPEDLVRFMGRNFKQGNRSETSVLEVGCGPGANLWFLHREGYKVSGIDGSAAAVEKAGNRLKEENSAINPVAPDLRVGNFSTLPWGDESFDVAIDIFSIYANPSEVIDQTLSEVFRVLKPGGRLYSKLWGTKTTGFGLGKKIERYTFDEIPKGPCHDMGVTHFFDQAEIEKCFSKFQIDAVDKTFRTDLVTQSEIEELWCQFTKPHN